jgi:hypothetical protein
MAKASDYLTRHVDVEPTPAFSFISVNDAWGIAVHGVRDRMQ